MHTYIYMKFRLNYFLETYGPFVIKSLAILLRQFVSENLKDQSRTELQQYVVDEDIMCSFLFLQEILI